MGGWRTELVVGPVGRTGGLDRWGGPVGLTGGADRWG